MNKKDLFKGLNDIDEDLISEATPDAGEDKGPLTRKELTNKLIKFILPIAAIFAISIFGSRLIGTETIRDYQANNAIKSSANYVGIKSEDKLGSLYNTVTDYGQIYDRLKTADIYIAEDAGYGMEGTTANSGSVALPSTNKTESYNGSVEHIRDDSQASSESDKYSTTNIMTDGVDESDVVKTNGSFIYAVRNREIVITDIREGDITGTRSFKPVFEAPSDIIKELYVTEDELIIITEHLELMDPSSKTGDRAQMVSKNSMTICYCYDIKNGFDPKLTGHMKQDGYYYTSRKVGEQFYLFTNHYMCKPDLDRTEAIKETGLGSWIPQVNDRFLSYDCVYLREENYGGLLISSFDLTKPGQTIDSKLIMSDTSNVYISEDAIYFYGTSYNGRNITEISKIDYKDGKLTVGTNTTVGGFIADSFAIRQHNGSLYVLATDAEYASNGRSPEVNTLYVFDKELKEIGELSGIARGERVYAARFLGNYIYFITYKNTDPLFVADISDPKKPKILGELEVSGFSEYLHIWDKNHVLGIGYGDRTEGQESTPIKLVMFDVSNPAKPIEENQFILKNPGYYCEAMHNYKAILASPEKNLIGFASDSYFMYSYSKDRGFEQVTKHDIKDGMSSGYRGLYSGNNIYIASAAEVVKVEK